VLFHPAVSWLTLPTCQLSMVVIVRSSCPGAASNWLSSRLRRYCALSDWPGATSSVTLPFTFSLAYPSRSSLNEKFAGSTIAL
jgi:hypothetical protein